MSTTPADENSWRTSAFRIIVVQKIEESIQRYGMPINKTSIEMENHVYQKAKTKEEYLSFIARLILHLREFRSNRRDGMEAAGAGGSRSHEHFMNEPSEE